MKQGKRAASLAVRFAFYAIFLIACTPKITEVTTPPKPNSNPPEPSAYTPTPTQRPNPTLTASAIPTVDPVTGLASKFDVSAACLFDYLMSSDESWIGADCKLFRELVVANELSGTKITLPYSEIEKEAAANFSTHPLSWSSDNRYFYFTTRCCEYDDVYNNNGSLYQLDIETSSLKILVKAVSEPFYFFSSDGERYIYLNHYPPNNSGFPELIEVGMVDIPLNKSNRMVFKYIWGPLDEKPEYAWSENNNSFAIVLRRIKTISEHTVEFEDVVLRMNFSRMEMLLVEEFDRNNLLGE